MMDYRNGYEAAAMQLGFAYETVGGGCTALTRYLPGGVHIMITDHFGCEKPNVDAGDWVIGVYDIDGTQVWEARDIGPRKYRVALCIAMDRAQEIVPTIDTLTDDHEQWCEAQGLECNCALEMLMGASGSLTDAQRDHLSQFCKVWDDVQAWDDAKQAAQARGESW